MSNQRIKVPRASDRSIVKLFKTLNELHNAGPFTITALGPVTIRELDHLTADKNNSLQLILRQNSQIIDTCSTSIKGLSIAYYRGGHCQPEQKSAIFDEIVLIRNNNQEAPPPAATIEAIATINKQLKPLELERVISSSKLEAESQLTAIHQATLERLEQLNEDLILKSSEFRENLESKYEEKSKALEREIEEKKNTLEIEHNKKAADIEKREQSLNERLAQIDDRDNTHARREIRERMLSDIKQRISSFGLSKTTERKRIPIVAGIASLALILATLILHTTTEIHNHETKVLDLIKEISAKNNESENPNIKANLSIPEIDKGAIYWLWIKLSILSFGLAGTILYYIKWQNKWAEQHASTELQLRQFYIDVDRASWVIESCLEWRKETGSTIPKELIASITNNLFKSQQPESEKVIHPADELASALMGSASKLRLKLGDNEMEFDKPSKISKKPIPSSNPDQVKN